MKLEMSTVQPAYLEINHRIVTNNSLQQHHEQQQQQQQQQQQLAQERREEYHREETKVNHLCLPANTLQKSKIPTGFYKVE